MKRVTLAIGLENFPPLPSLAKDSGQTYAIAVYLEQVLDENGINQSHKITLPSLMALAHFFETNHLVVHDAFQHLRGKGYDYLLAGLEHPISFWRQMDPNKP